MRNARTTKLLATASLLAGVLLLAACGGPGEQAAEPEETLPEETVVPAAEPDLTPREQAAQLLARCKTVWETETVLVPYSSPQFDDEAYPECGAPPYPRFIDSDAVLLPISDPPDPNSEQLLARLLSDYCKSVWVDGGVTPPYCGEAPDLPGLERIYSNPCTVTAETPPSWKYVDLSDASDEPCEGHNYVDEAGVVIPPPPLPPLGDPSQCVVEEPPEHIETVDFTTQSRIHEGGEPYPPGTFPPRHEGVFVRGSTNDINLRRSDTSVAYIYTTNNHFIFELDDRPLDPCAVIQPRLRDAGISYERIEVRDHDYYAPHMEAYPRFDNLLGDTDYQVKLYGHNVPIVDYSWLGSPGVLGFPVPHSLFLISENDQFRFPEGAYVPYARSHTSTCAFLEVYITEHLVSGIYTTFGDDAGIDRLCEQ